MTILAEYIWIDGYAPTQNLRSKTKVFRSDRLKASTAYADLADIPVDAFPEWGADGSSTMQAGGNDSDIKLVPVRACRDPFREGAFLVLCEVQTGEGNDHTTNFRAPLRQTLSQGGASLTSWFGFEQEFTFMTNHARPAGFPVNGFPEPQGPYYCGVGTGKIIGRSIYEDFITASLKAGLPVTGFNWEVMPGQAEVQVFGDALAGPDFVWLMRWVLHRTSEDHDLIVSLDPKPAQGDWNGAGMHTNFSTEDMRKEGGLAAIEAACEAIGEKVQEHLAEYGDGYERRLTGAHETASYSQFSWGAADRTASIRVPRHVAEQGKGYLEDRRPNANACPYRIANRLIKTVAGIA